MVLPVRGTTLLSVWLLGYLVALGNSSPGCLDYRAPYVLSEPLQFCTDYTKYSCCTADRDVEIKREYEQFKLDLLADNISTECVGYAKEILCAECSPYASKIFKLGDTGVQHDFPGICTSYCQTFIPKCGTTMSKMYDFVILKLSLANKNTGCNYVSMDEANSDYCYPEVSSNQRLIEEVSEQMSSSEDCLCLEEFASGLANPLVFTIPPDDSGRIFVAEQQGIVEIFYKNKTKVPQPFLDFKDKVLVSSTVEDERGFLNLAFHPNFKENRKFYIFYSAKVDGKHHTKILELKENPVIPNKIDPNSRKPILDVEQPYPNHNGGQVLIYCVYISITFHSSIKWLKASPVSIISEIQ